MEKMLIICPHLSTGGAPQFSLNKIELLKDSYDIWCVEWSFLSPDFVVQRNKIIEILGDKFIPLHSDGEKLIEIINKISPDIISFEEIAETFMDSKIIEWIHRADRGYKILESTHSSHDNSKSKLWLPDKFIFVSEWSKKMYAHFGVESEVIEYPVDRKSRNKLESQEKLGLDPSVKHVVNIGLFTQGKNQGYAFDIARNSGNDVVFHFIGNQAGNFRDYWEPLMEKKPDNCIVWGERGDAEEFIKAADLFLFTSKFELNPLVVKEALCYGDLPVLMFDLETYMGRYDGVRDINYLSGDLKSDVNKLVRSIGVEKAGSKKIRAVHLLIDTDSERERKSIESMSSISGDIEYIQNINERYTGDAWRDQVPMCGWANHGPGHYGSFMSFKSGIENHFSDDLDAFMIFEADCVLEVDVEKFTNLVYRAIDFCEKYNIEYLSFGDRYCSGVLNSPELEKYPDFSEFIVTNKVILTHCILFTKKSRGKLLEALKTKSWDSPDLWFNDHFNRMAIVERPTAVQYPGYSMIDNVYKDFNYFSSKTREEVIPNILNFNNLNGIGVEIGVFKGQFSKHIIDNWSGTLYMVDPWRELENYIDSSNHINHPTAYLETMERIKGFENRAIMIRALSSKAVNLFQDNSLDFVYIDGNHSYESVKEDMELWYPKLKSGGVFSGHDYLRMDWDSPPFAENGKDKHIWMKGGLETDEHKYAGIFGVNPAVDEFCKERGIKPYLTSEWTATWIIFK